MPATRMKTRRAGSASDSGKPARPSIGYTSMATVHAIGDAAKATVATVGDVAKSTMTAVTGAARATRKYLTRSAERTTRQVLVPPIPGAIDRDTARSTPRPNCWTAAGRENGCRLDDLLPM